MEANDLVQEFSKQLASGCGSIFVGSGISCESNVPSWLNLLKNMAQTRVGLEIGSEDNLPLIAQHIVNQASGNRGPLVQHFSRELTKNYCPNPYHAALARMNVSSLWTTNYDSLLEDSFRQHFKVNVTASDDAVVRNVDNFQIEVVKVHGCIKISPHDDLVVTEEDYENFFVKRPAIARKLSQELLDKSFLFIGYSYEDPNISNILIEARRLARNATRQHYIILKRVSGDDKIKRKAKQKQQNLWLKDLERVGILACQIDDFTELQNILDDIAVKSRGNTIFVTGSHDREKSTQHLQQLGKLLAQKKDIVLIDGQSSGTSRFVVSSYLEECIDQKIDTLNRLRVFHNPYAANPNFSNKKSLLATLKEWRFPLLRSTQIMVVYNGGMGTEAEIEVAEELGCMIIPVPQRKEDLPFRLLKKNKNIKKLVGKDYRRKALSLKVKPKDVMKCIQNVMKT